MASLRSFVLHRHSFAMCLLGVALVASPLAGAAGLEVTPTTLQIQSQQSAEGITLSNVGDTPMHAQVRVFAWSQKDNEDLLAPSSGITVSPPMLQIAPGTSQLLRVIRTGPAPAPGTEQAYRLIIDEIPASVVNPKAAPTPPASSSGAPKTPAVTALNFYMRYSLPVFVGDTSDATAPQLSWRLDKSAKQWTLSVSNTGATRAQVADLEAVLSDDKHLSLVPGLVGYVLAGQTRHWSMNIPDNAQKVVGFEAMINRKTQKLDVASTP